MIYIFWSDWDNTKVVEIDTVEEAEEVLATLKAKEDDDDYGTRIHAVIEGKKLKITTVQVTSKIKLDNREGL